MKPLLVFALVIAGYFSTTLNFVLTKTIFGNSVKQSTKVAGDTGNMVGSAKS